MLGRKNGPSRSQSSAPWILRRSSVKSDVFNSPRWHALSKVFLSHNTLQLSHPSLPKLSNLTSFKRGLYRSSLTRAGMPFGYVICFQFRSFFIFFHFRLDWKYQVSVTFDILWEVSTCQSRNQLGSHNELGDRWLPNQMIRSSSVLEIPGVWWVAPKPTTSKHVLGRCR